MEKKTKRGKAVALSLAMAAALSLPPSNLSAQDGGGLFGRGETDAGGSRAGSSHSGGLLNDGFGSSYGSGVFNDGFGSSYGGGVYSDGFGSSYGGGIVNDGFDSVVPLGGGLLVMTAAAAGYAMLRRRKPEARTQQN